MASVASATSDWTGATSNDWALGSNWSDGGPDSVERRDVAFGTPVVSADSTAGVVQMGRTNTGQTLANATLTVSSGTLTVTSGGNQLVSVAYATGVTNNLNVSGGNLVVYNSAGAGTGEIRLQNVTDSVGYLNLSSGSIDVEQLNLGSRTSGLGTFTATGGTLTIRKQISKFGTVATNPAYGFRLGGATLEIAPLALADRDTKVIGSITIGGGGESDFIMDSTSVLALDLGADSGAAGTDWDRIISHGNYTIDGTLAVNFTVAPTYGDSWVVWTVDDAVAYSGSGTFFDTITSSLGTVTASWDDADTLRLTYTPEPATIALFGLGLLVLRRNKK